MHDQQPARKFQIVGQRLQRQRVNGDKALLAAAAALDEGKRQVDVVHVQRNELADLNARRVQQLQHRLIADALEVVRRRLREQQLDFLVREHLRPLLGDFVVRDFPGGIMLRRADRNQVLVQSAQSGQRTAHRAGGQPPAQQVLLVRRHVGRLHPVEGRNAEFLRIIEEFLHIALIRRKGIGRAVLLLPEIRHIVLVKGFHFGACLQIGHHKNRPFYYTISR